jgi:hypothetical protein
MVRSGRKFNFSQLIVDHTRVGNFGSPKRNSRNVATKGGGSLISLDR